MLYQAFKVFAVICFNLLNMLLGGNLPPFACVCIIVEEEQRFLVLEQPNGIVVFPAGFVRWEELPEQAAIREGKEETGLQLHPTHVLGCYPQISNHINRMSTLCIAYQAKVIGGQLRKSIEGRPYWINQEELLEKLSSFYLPVFQDYLRYRAQQSEASIHDA